MRREATRPVGLWQGCSSNRAIAIIFSFVVLAAWASRQWARIDYRFGAEWLLRRLAR